MITAIHWYYSNVVETTFCVGRGIAESFEVGRQEIYGILKTQKQRINYMDMRDLFLACLLISCFNNYHGADGFLRDRDHCDLSPRSHVYKESIPELSTRVDIAKQSRMSHDHVHEVVFVIRQNNMEALTHILHDVSDPRSKNYGQHLNGTEVADLTSNPESLDAVTTFININGGTVVSQTLNGEYLTANATISVWEKLFNTHFFMFHQFQSKDVVNKFVRAESYSIPFELDPHIESVFNTIQVPYKLFGDLSMPMSQPGVNSNYLANVSSYMNPAKLRSAYNMGSAQGSAFSTQCIFAIIGEVFSPSDLNLFQKSSGLPYQTIEDSIGDHVSDSVCAQSPNSCAEANLDVQYITAASPGSPTTYWYTDSLFSSWLVTVANTPNPPLVLSISYGAEEIYVSASEKYAFNTAAIKMGAMGITLVAASGDDGANTRYVRSYGTSVCRYSALFPASNPYVTAVGATSGPESGTAEVACQADNGKPITSGGGFSSFYPQLSFQKSFIVDYFATAFLTSKFPFSGFNRSGRAYPDVSLAGYNYGIFIGGYLYSVSGTSASAPVIAGLFSNINAARNEIGKGPIGWANPALYSTSKLFANDVTSGNNKCGATKICCPHGFYATTGWDPVTGLGSVDYMKMQAAFLSLGGVTGQGLTKSTGCRTSAKIGYTMAIATITAAAVVMITM